MGMIQARHQSRFVQRVLSVENRQSLNPPLSKLFSTQIFSDKRSSHGILSFPQQPVRRHAVPLIFMKQGLNQIRRGS